MASASSQGMDHRANVIEPKDAEVGNPERRPTNPTSPRVAGIGRSIMTSSNSGGKPPLNFDFKDAKPTNLLAETTKEALPMVLLLRCANFAAMKHARQRRKDPQQTPYINHPLGVAMILADEGGVTDVDVLLAAILHDTVEDTETSFEEIEEHFGPAVRKIVEEVTDDRSLSWQERKQNQVLHARHTSFEAKLVKLADKLYNLRDINRVYPVGWTEIRVQRYFDWAKQVCLGLRGTNDHLEKKLDDVFDARQRYVEVNNKCIEIPGHECAPDYDMPPQVDTSTNLLGSEPESRILSKNASAVDQKLNEEKPEN